ncbi:MAG: helix-turn-helix domain-containing protein [Turicibacter sp.]|nr:helix-turn-helix domain-containing protein [Turicibacter sp.]
MTGLTKRFLEQSDQIIKERTGEADGRQSLTVGSGDTKEPGFYLKEARIRKGMTQEEATKGICDPSFLSKIESLQTAWDEDSLICQQLKTRVGAVFSQNADGPWLQRYYPMLWGHKSQKLKLVIDGMAEGFQKQVLLLILYVILGMPALGQCLVQTYFSKLEPYLSPSELRLYYLCIGCYYVGYDSAYYLLNALRMARYSRLQDPYLNMVLARHLLSSPLDWKFHPLLRVAEQHFLSGGYAFSHIQCLLLQCQGFLKDEVLAMAGPMLARLKTLSSQMEGSQKAHLLMLLGISSQLSNQPKDAETHFTRSLMLSKKYGDQALFEACLIRLAALYSYHQKEKKLQGLMGHPYLTGHRFDKCTRFKLAYFQARQTPSHPQHSPVYWKKAFGSAQENIDHDFVHLYADFLVGQVKGSRKNQQILEINQALDAFAELAKTFQKSLNHQLVI